MCEDERGLADSYSSTLYIHIQNMVLISSLVFNVNVFAWIAIDGIIVLALYLFSLFTVIF